MLKMLTVNSFFNISTDKEFVLEKWVDHSHISINQKNLQKLGLKRNIY